MSEPSSARDRAFSAWTGQRFGEVIAAVSEWLAAEPASGEAYQLAGQALVRLGDPTEAAKSFENAEALGGGPACAFNAGNAWQAAGDRELAIKAWLRAADGQRALGAHALSLGRSLAAAGERTAAAKVLAALVRRDPAAQAAMQLVVELAAADRDRALAPLRLDAPGPMAPPGSWSIVVCSVDEDRFAAFSSTIAARFAGVEHEVVRISDAASLCEGFARGLARSRGDAVVFCHDDIDILAPDAVPRLAAHLTRFDMVGAAGATRVSGPAVFWAGHPHLHGWVSYRKPGDADYEATAMSLEGPLVGGIEALDGVFIACRREAAVATGFDAETFDGFHLYDLDFSHRAHRSGLRLAVACDLGLVHASKGSFGSEWSRYADRFRAKFPALNGPQGSPHFYVTRVPAAGDVLAFQRRLAEFAAA